jgi:hypothetical protein
MDCSYWLVFHPKYIAYLFLENFIFSLESFIFTPENFIFTPGNCIFSLESERACETQAALSAGRPGYSLH